MDTIVRVASYDGQTVWLENRVPLYEVGNFLGGGAAGTVYEAENVKTKEHFALKILNPLGYKMMSPSLLRRCTVMSKGKPVAEAAERAKEPISKEHVWWLLNGSTKQYVVAYYSERQRSLHELSLVQCMHIWGVDLPEEGPAAAALFSSATSSGSSPLSSPSSSRAGAGAGGGGSSPGRSTITIPALPPKYEDFVRRRARLCREICNMRKISPHPNVIRLESVLELAQDSKCTLFLLMELANGGELFDRIKIDCGTVEDTAGRFFSQLLQGVRHCHDEGVCHRDLKPENLLLQDSPGGGGGPLLKIADFGFSARLAMSDHEFSGTTAACSPSASSLPPSALSLSTGTGGGGAGGSHSHCHSPTTTSPTSASASFTSPMRVLLSVVGSPFYVAPEVLQAHRGGYDGRKADSWSMGVILYAMLAGNLPFAQELASCKRFRQFCVWAREQSAAFSSKFWQDPALECPPWLFSLKFSSRVRGLIVAMLLPDPADRISVKEAQQHSWCRAHGSPLPPPRPPLAAPVPPPVPPSVHSDPSGGGVGRGPVGGEGGVEQQQSQSQNQNEGPELDEEENEVVVVDKHKHKHNDEDEEFFSQRPAGGRNDGSSEQDRGDDEVWGESKPAASVSVEVLSLTETTAGANKTMLSDTNSSSSSEGTAVNLNTNAETDTQSGSHGPSPPRSPPALSSSPSHSPSSLPPGVHSSSNSSSSSPLKEESSSDSGSAVELSAPSSSSSSGFSGFSGSKQSQSRLTLGLCSTATTATPATTTTVTAEVPAAPLALQGQGKELQTDNSKTHTEIDTATETATESPSLLSQMAQGEGLGMHGVSLVTHSLDLMDVESDYEHDQDDDDEEEDEGGDDTTEQFLMEEEEEDSEEGCESALKRSKKSPGAAKRRFDRPSSSSASSFGGSNAYTYPSTSTSTSTSTSSEKTRTDASPPFPHSEQQKASATASTSAPFTAQEQEHEYEPRGGGGGGGGGGGVFDPFIQGQGPQAYPRAIPRHSPAPEGGGGHSHSHSHGSSLASSLASSPRRSNSLSFSLSTPPPHLPTDMTAAIPAIMARTPDLLDYLQLEGGLEEEEEESLALSAAAGMYPSSSPHRSSRDRESSRDRDMDGGGGGVPSRSMFAFGDDDYDDCDLLDSHKEDVAPPCFSSSPTCSSSSSSSSSCGSPLSSSSRLPPSFHDAVKRSTRFITSVPACEVLETVESILEQCRIHRTLSPIGVIGRVELHWETYRLDVWGQEQQVSAPPLCSLHLYQLPASASACPSAPGSPVRMGPGSSSSSSSPLFLVEFVRGQLEIFAFKRFYEWVRQRVSELVKRDYAFSLFDQSGSPIQTSHIASSPLRGVLQHSQLMDRA